MLKFNGFKYFYHIHRYTYKDILYICYMYMYIRQSQ